MFSFHFFHLAYITNTLHGISATFSGDSNTIINITLDNEDNRHLHLFSTAEYFLASLANAFPSKHHNYGGSHLH